MSAGLSIRAYVRCAPSRASMAAYARLCCVRLRLPLCICQCLSAPVRTHLRVRWVRVLARAFLYLATRVVPGLRLPVPTRARTSPVNASAHRCALALASCRTVLPPSLSAHSTVARE